MITDLIMCRDQTIMIQLCQIIQVKIIKDLAGLVVKNNGLKTTQSQLQVLEATLYHQKLLKVLDSQQDVNQVLILN